MLPFFSFQLTFCSFQPVTLVCRPVSAQFQANLQQMIKPLRWLGFVITLLFFLAAVAVMYVRTSLPDTGPAPDLSLEHTPERIARGRYLAHHVAACLDCHTLRDKAFFAGPSVPGQLGAGGERFDREPAGIFYAPNITPAGLGTWTDGEILRAIATGVSREGRALFPVMPYHAYGQMDEEDLYSIIVYLRTLPPVARKIPDRELAFPLRFLINLLPARAKLTPAPPRSDQVAYGGYLAGMAGCTECHSKTGKAPGALWGGGMEFSQPAGVVRSANISPDDTTGIGRWSKERFIQRFKMYAVYPPARLLPGDLNTPMPWNHYAGMTEQDLGALFAFLQSVQPVRNAVRTFEKQP